MNIETGREFCYTNPQDDPHLYTPSYYGLEGGLRANPRRELRANPGGELRAIPGKPTKDKHYCCWPWPWLGRK